MLITVIDQYDQECPDERDGFYSQFKDALELEGVTDRLISNSLNLTSSLIFDKMSLSDKIYVLLPKNMKLATFKEHLKSLNIHDVVIDGKIIPVNKDRVRRKNALLKKVDSSSLKQFDTTLLNAGLKGKYTYLETTSKVLNGEVKDCNFIGLVLQENDEKTIQTVLKITKNKKVNINFYFRTKLSE